MANELVRREPLTPARDPAVPAHPAVEPAAPAVALPQPAPRDGERKDFLRQRLLSLDVYRGLIMVTLAFTGFGLAATATRHLRAEGPSPFWEAVHYQFEHVQWVGCGYWDLIQPSFMFMVGLAAAFSYAKRRQLGQPYGRMFGHALWRSVVLVLLGIFLKCTAAKYAMAIRKSAVSSRLAEAGMQVRISQRRRAEMPAPQNIMERQWRR